MMRYFALLLAISFAIPEIARAQLSLPDLWIKAENRRLELVSLSINVTLEGTIAETVLELEYFNSGHRNAEGEFTMKLPKGATVSTYALEVNGKMRPGVSVGKNEARFAYESIKARNVDPGIVEREADNTYRTRIFPIFPQKSKKVRIGFIHPIPDGNYLYRFNREEEIKNFSCSIQGSIKGQPTLKLREEEHQLDGEFSTENVPLEGSLNGQSLLPEGNGILTRFDLDGAGNLYFVAQGNITKAEPATRNWKEIQIIWDISHSGNWRNHQLEFAALQQILKHAGDCTVNVYFLGDALSAPKKFDIKSGDPALILNYLKTPLYDGISDFSKIPTMAGHTLIFSDGQAALPRWGLQPPVSGCRRYLFHSNRTAISPFLADKLTGIYDISNKPGGEPLDFAKADWDLKGWWGDFLVDQEVNLTTNLADDLWNFRSMDDRFILNGKVPRDQIDRAKIKVGDNVEIRFGEDRKNAQTLEWNFSRRVWSEQRLATLENSRNIEKITDFAIRERLVSDYTSLIVLETFEDHLTYNIPPPEPDLLARYQKEKSSGNTLYHKWTFKKEWHNHPFKWFDFDLTEKIQQVAIWTSSSQAAFTEKTLNRKPIERYVAWQKRAGETIGKRSGVESGKAFKNWLREIDQQLEELNAIREATPTADPDNNIYVSVRGGVSVRGIFTGRPPYTLQDAVREAKVPDYHWNSRVFLYRNANRTGYNLLNRALQPVPLKWGDMIVVDKPDYEYPAFLGDPFAADPFFAAAEASPRQTPVGPAVFEDHGSFLSSPSETKWNQEDESIQGRQKRFEIHATAPRTKEYLNQLKSDSDPWKAYQDDIKQNGALSLSDTIAIAVIFFDKKDPDKGTKILANLFELIPHPIEAPRSYAYWLAQFGFTSEGEKILLELLTSSSLESRTRALLYFDIGQITGKAEAFRQSVIEESKAFEISSLSTIALTDAFRREEKVVLEIKPYVMTSDYRIVVTGMGQSFQLGVLIPPRFRGLTSDESSRQASAAGVVEHQSIKALPGVATVELQNAEPGTYHVVIYRKFGSEKEVIIKKETILLDDVVKKSLGEIDFDWDDIEIDFQKHLPAEKAKDPFGF